MPKTGISPTISAEFTHEAVAIPVTDTAVEVVFDDNVTKLTINSPTIDLWACKTELGATTPATGGLNSRFWIPGGLYTFVIKEWAGSSIWIVNKVSGEVATAAADLIYIGGER